MRRRLPDDGGVPPHLAVFKSADWPGERGYDRWTKAREAWVAAGPGGAAGELNRLGELTRLSDQITQASRVPDMPWPY